jgi:hypothetical protein
VWGPDEEIDLGGEGWMDDSGFGLPRTCPTVPAITVLDQAIEFPPVWCDLLSMMGTLLLIGASWAAFKIVGNG